MILDTGDIVALDFSPTKGHEQSGYRPAVVVSRKLFQKQTGLIVVCPITNTQRSYPTRIALDSRTVVKGDVICEQIRTIDVNARNVNFLEHLPGDLLDRVLDIVVSIFD